MVDCEKIKMLRKKAEGLEAEIETIFEDSTGTAEEQGLLDTLFYDLALTEDELDHVMPPELLDEDFDLYDSLGIRIDHEAERGLD